MKSVKIPENINEIEFRNWLYNLKLTKSGKVPYLFVYPNVCMPNRMVRFMKNTDAIAFVLKFGK